MVNVSSNLDSDICGAPVCMRQAPGVWDQLIPAEAWNSEDYGSAEGPPRGVENRNLLSHPDDLRMEVYVIRMT